MKKKTTDESNSKEVRQVVFVPAELRSVEADENLTDLGEQLSKKDEEGDAK